MAKLYQVVIGGTIYGQIWTNVHFYAPKLLSNGVVSADVTDIETTALAVATSFNTQVKPSLVAAVIGDVLFSYITAKNLLDPTDAATVDLTGQVGTRAAAAAGGLPAHDAINFTLETAGNVGRPGSKRIPGINSAEMVDGIITVAPTITAMNTLASKYDDALTIAGNITYSYMPVIVKRIQHVIVNGIKRYRLPESIGEVVLRAVVAVLWNVAISTQNSRKQ